MRSSNNTLNLHILPKFTAITFYASDNECEKSCTYEPNDLSYTTIRLSPNNTGSYECKCGNVKLYNIFGYIDDLVFGYSAEGQMVRCSFDLFLEANWIEAEIRITEEAYVEVEKDEHSLYTPFFLTQTLLEWSQEKVANAVCTWKFTVSRDAIQVVYSDNTKVTIDDLEKLPEKTTIPVDQPSSKKYSNTHLGLTFVALFSLIVLVIVAARSFKSFREKKIVAMRNKEVEVDKVSKRDGKGDFTFDENSLIFKARATND
ncbi:hypothetical protein HELRODRAFT_161772 [Helobdella robusta]|uniref:Uncharacterized protein n=1 Tax=Helobdella robusta TaxID=6412 RepID=T1ERW4_HELRO|nr:hypothetical protein HELRODRAFT_161772 [Helobdella robusta]ESO02497.1 hypothetical protein HELRODRAFT_161772 [Helobdella robusta]